MGTNFFLTYFQISVGNIITSSMQLLLIGLSHYNVYRRRMPTYETIRKDVGVCCISWRYVFHKLRARYHTLVYVVIRRTCPKILCMHKISNVCRRIDYTLDIHKTYATHTLCIRSRMLHVSYSYVNKRCNTLQFVGRLFSV